MTSLKKGFGQDQDPARFPSVGLCFVPPVISHRASSLDLLAEYGRSESPVWGATDLNGKGHCQRRLQSSCQEDKHLQATEGGFLGSQLTHGLM